MTDDKAKIDDKKKITRNPHADKTTAWFLWQAWDTAMSNIASLGAITERSSGTLSKALETRAIETLNKLGGSIPDQPLYPRNTFEAGTTEWQLFEEVLRQRRLQAAHTDDRNRAIRDMDAWIKIRDDIQMIFEFIDVPINGKKNEA